MPDAYRAPLARELKAALGKQDEVILDRLLYYVRLLLTANEKINLTAITDPEGVAVRHFADSWTLLPLLRQDREEGKRQPGFLDIGSGAGFPGLALALLCPDWHFSLLDAQKKRVSFLERTVEALALTHVEVVWGRAELLAHEARWREHFDLVTARAVTALSPLLELGLPFVRLGGRFIAMRGQAEELPASLHLLGGRLQETETRLLRGEEKRTLHVLEKWRATPEDFPRPYARIRKRPLV